MVNVDSVNWLGNYTKDHIPAVYWTDTVTSIYDNMVKTFGTGKYLPMALDVTLADQLRMIASTQPERCQMVSWVTAEIRLIECAREEALSAKKIVFYLEGLEIYNKSALLDKFPKERRDDVRSKVDILSHHYHQMYDSCSTREISALFVLLGQATSYDKLFDFMKAGAITDEILEKYGEEKALMIIHAALVEFIGISNMMMGTKGELKILTKEE